MSTEKFTTEDIEATYIQMGLPFQAQDFISALKKQTKERKTKEKEIEDAKPNRIEVYHIYPSQPEGTDIEVFIKNVVTKADYSDFFDEEDMPDEGADGIDYYKVGDKIYEVEVQCEAEWVSDWSMRKNVAGDVTANGYVKEIKNFTIEKEGEGYIVVLVPKK